MADPPDRSRAHPLTRGPTQRRATSLAITLWIGLGLGCSSPTEFESKPDATGAAVEHQPARVELGTPGLFGCAGLRRSDAEFVCRLRKPKPLRAWLADRRDATIRVELDGATLPSTLTRDAAGLIVEFEPPTTSGRVALHGEGGEVWRFALEGSSDAALVLRKQANARAREGDFAGADAVFASAIEQLDRDELDLLRCDEARVAMAARAFDRVLALADELAGSSTISCAAAAHLLAAYVRLFERPDFEAAAASLAAVEPFVGVDLEAAIGLRYLEGVYDHRLGRLDESLVAFVEAQRLAERVGDDAQALAAQTMQAVALARLGRLAEAEPLTAAILATLGEHAASDPLIRDVRYDLAWVALLRREVDPQAPDPSDSLRALIAEYSRADSPVDVARTRLHLVHALLRAPAGRAAAQLEFDAIDAKLLDVHSRVWYELAGFELQHSNGKGRAAEKSLDRAERFANLTFDRDHHYRIAAARGALARGRGDHDGALEHLRRASEVADELALAVPGAAGRSMLITSHLRADAELLDLLVELDRPRDALCVAVGVRARHLRALWARARPRLPAADERELGSLLGQHRAARLAIEAQLADAWQLPGPELDALERELERASEDADALLRRATALLERDAPAWTCARVTPRAGEALLAMAPGASEGRWHFFAWRSFESGADADAGRVDHVALAGSPEARARGALAAFEQPLEGRARLLVIPAGDLTSVDFHALLGERAGGRELALGYSLGLGRGPEPAEPVVAGQPRASVVVGSRDLAAAREEGREVADALARRGWTVAREWAPAADEQPTLLHYAGHGQLAGPSGWESHVEVPGFGRLSAAQIVATQRAPRVVVLGACSTGAMQGEILDGGMNLATALLLAGAELVVAPSGPVDDQAALELARALHGEVPADPSEHPSEALIEALARAQAGQAEVPTTSPRSFARWRAWVP